MRVTMITRDYPPRINGGLSTAVGGLVRALIRAGATCDVVSFDGYRPRRNQHTDAPPVRQREQGVEILRIVAPSQLPAAEAFCRRGDVLHVHHAMLWELAERVAAGRPTIFTVHAAQAWMRKLRAIDSETASEQAQARAIERASIVTVPSAAVPIAGAQVLPLGTEPIDASQINATQPETMALPEPINAQVNAIQTETMALPEPPTALYVGRFGDVKGTRELLEAIPRIAERSSLRFVVAGGLPDNRKADKRWRRRFAEHAPSAELVGWLSPIELQKAYRRASFVVVPSWYETFGQVIIEAMQHGVPAIASNAGGIPDLIGDTGIVVAPRNVNALCNAIVDLAHDHQRLLDLRQACLLRAPEWHWDRRIKPWLRLYEQLSITPQ